MISSFFLAVWSLRCVTGAQWSFVSRCFAVAAAHAVLMQSTCAAQQAANRQESACQSGCHILSSQGVDSTVGDPRDVEVQWFKSV